MHALTELRRATRAIPLIAVTAGTLRRTVAGLGRAASAWVRSNEFRAEPGRCCAIPDPRGRVRTVLVGVAQADDLYALSALPYTLPPGTYRLESSALELDVERAALGWGLGAYRFTRYRKSPRTAARLAVDAAALRAVEGPLAA